MKSVFNGLFSLLGAAEERMSEIEDKSIETSQLKLKKKKEWK